VARDVVQAYRWIALAAAQGDAGAQRNLKVLERRMTAEQIAQGQRLAREWKPSPSSASSE
jgi:TPR repeat protein